MNARSVPAALLVVVLLGIAIWQHQTHTHQVLHMQAELKASQARADALRAELGAVRAQAPDPAELDRLRKAEAALQLEVARLRNEVATAQRGVSRATSSGTPTAVPSEPATPPAAKPAMSPVMAFAMKTAVQQQTVGKLTRLKPRLNLTPEQEEAVRGILTRQAEQATAVAEQMLSGKLSASEAAARKQDAGNPEAEIRALLTPEQLEAYDAFKQEENVGNARLVANAELLQMQSTLGLSPEQQDRVFNALYDLTLDTLNGKNLPTPATATDPGGLVNWQWERKRQALEPILTPEQLDAFRKFQETQRKLIEGFLPPKAAAAEPAPAAP